MNKDVSRLGKVSGYFFFSGFVLSKLRYFPIPVVTPVITLFSLSLYLIGYSLWFFATHLHPHHPPKKEEWYGFTQFKKQYLYAAILGIFATTLSMVAVFIPVLIIPAAWIFFASNVIWTITEYHKLKNPPNEPQFSTTRQSHYLSYAITMSSIGLITAISTTLAFLFPPFALLIFIASAITCGGLGVFAAEHWLEFTFGSEQSKRPLKHSYHLLQNALGASTDPQDECSLVPLLNNTLLAKNSQNASTLSEENDEEETESLNQSPVLAP